MRKIASAHLSLRHEICIEVAAATNTKYIYASDDVFDYYICIVPHESRNFRAIEGIIRST